MTLDDILSKVQQESAQEAKVETLLSEVNTELKTALANGDQAKLQQISDTLDANIQTLTAAVTQNSPDPVQPPAPSASGSDVTSGS